MSASEPSTVRVAARQGGTCVDWVHAVRSVGDLLVDLGVAGPQYVEACVESVHVNGPYIVLAPGLALAHARPEQGATGLGVGLVRLAEPVEFGHPSNDPVDLVFAFATPDANGHLAMLRSLAGALGAGLATSLREASPDELTRILDEAVNHA